MIQSELYSDVQSCDGHGHNVTLFDKNRLAVSESVYTSAHDGAKMDNHRKLTVAKVLENTNRFMNEAFDNSVATQRSDMGLWKKFCL